MTLDAADLLATVVSVQAAAFAGPDALTAHDGRAGSGITGAHLVPLVRAGALFENGHLVERTESTAA
ncbi:hypothetical protein ACH4S8_42375 [Streptomyces sp. NPDC021080]|uniref:hypothetical protein n=1 Tax=Streptomyces sp. NPDC021080 TaxID=3365110 RepID=UPI0037931DD8